MRVPGGSLPGGGAIQQLKTRLRVSGEDDVFRRAKRPVADDHLDLEGEPGTYSDESLGVRVGQSLVDDHEGVRMKDHQGKETRDERFPQSWLAAESMSHSHWITFAFVNHVGAERAVGLASLVGFLGFVVSLVGGTHGPSLLSGSSVVEGGSLSGVNLPS